MCAFVIGLPSITLRYNQDAGRWRLFSAAGQAPRSQKSKSRSTVHKVIDSTKGLSKQITDGMQRKRNSTAGNTGSLSSPNFPHMPTKSAENGHNDGGPLPPPCQLAGRQIMFNSQVLIARLHRADISTGVLPLARGPPAISSARVLSPRLRMRRMRWESESRGMKCLGENNTRAILK